MHIIAALHVRTNGAATSRSKESNFALRSTESNFASRMQNRFLLPIQSDPHDLDLYSRSAESNFASQMQNRSLLRHFRVKLMP